MAARFGTGYFPIELGTRSESIGDKQMLDIGAGSNDHGYDADIDGYLFVKTLSEWQQFTTCLGEEMDPIAQYHPSADPSSDAGKLGFTKYSVTSQSYPQPENGPNCPFMHMMSLAPVIKQYGCLRVLENEAILKAGKDTCLPEDVVFPIRNVSLWGHALPVAREFWRHNLHAAESEYGNTCKDVALPSFLYSAASIPRHQLDNVLQACKHELAEGGFVTIDGYEKCNDRPIAFRPMQPCRPTSDGDAICGDVVPDSVDAQSGLNTVPETGEFSDRFFSGLLNVTSDSTCTFGGDGEFTDGRGRPKVPHMNYSCARQKAPPNAIRNINGGRSYVITCEAPKVLTVRLGSSPSQIIDPIIRESSEYATGKRVEMTGEYMEVECHERGYGSTSTWCSSGQTEMGTMFHPSNKMAARMGWIEVILRVQEKEVLKRRVRLNNNALDIAIIFIDSIARAEAMHYMPNTARLLKELHGGTASHQSFVFNRFQTTGGNSVQNLAPFFCGRSATGESHQTMQDNGGRFTACKKFIWNYLADHGYISVYGGSENNALASMHNWESQTISDNGHFVPTYQTACPTQGNPVYDPINCGSTLGCDNLYQFLVCCGSSTLGEYNFKYAADFHSGEVYPKASKFSIVSMDSAHESSSCSQSEDLAIYNFIKQMTTRNDTVVYLMSDHGNGNEGMQFPLGSFVIPTQFLNKYPAVRTNMQANQERLVNHFDMYETIKHFASFPALPEKVSWEEKGKPAAAKSLLIEEMPKNRTCSDIGTPVHYCACLHYELVTLPQLAQETPMAGHASYSDVITSTINEGVLGIQNARRKQAIEMGAASNCMELKLDEVTQIRISKNFIAIQGMAASEGGQDVWQFDVQYTVTGSNSAIYSIQFEMRAYVDTGNTDLSQPLPSTVTIHAHGMLTSYKPFAGCHDNRTDPNYCVCT